VTRATRTALADVGRLYLKWVEARDDVRIDPMDPDHFMTAARREETTRAELTAAAALVRGELRHETRH